MAKLAVINCKSMKATKPCMAKDMYVRSKLFRSQLKLIHAYYDTYVILSAKHGVVYPNQVIEPYNIAMSKGNRVKTCHVLTKEQKKVWATKVLNHEVWLHYAEIHLLISNPYFNPIKQIIKNSNIIRIKQQVNLGLNILVYEEAFKHLKETDELDLSIISTQKKSQNPEQARWFYHPIHGKFFGKSRDLVKQYPEVDEGNLSRVSFGKAKQTRGWVIHEEDASFVKCIKGIWRLKKG